MMFSIVRVLAAAHVDENDDDDDDDDEDNDNGDDEKHIDETKTQTFAGRHGFCCIRYSGRKGICC